MQAAMSLSGSIGELAGNAIDWGGGLRQINYYFAPKAAVIELLQEKEWDYKKILAKVANGLYPSSRKKSEKILHGGGNGLGVAGKISKNQISYQDKGRSTLILISRKFMEEYERA